MKLRITNIIIFFFIPKVIKCSNIEARDKNIFPNGTLIGTYTYVDAQGNNVHVKYFADGKSYSIDLRGYKLPENENLATFRNSPAEHNTESLDTMVPLKLDFPVIGDIYTIENPPNVTNDIAAFKKKYHHNSENDNQSEDIDDIDDSGLKISKCRMSGKDKKVKYKKAIRKIRQTLDTFMKKKPNLFYHSDQSQNENT